MLSQLARRYSAFVCRRPWLILLGALALFAPSIWLASKLELTTDFKDLLPRNRRSVTELDRIGQRMGGSGSFSIGSETARSSHRGDQHSPGQLL